MRQPQDADRQVAHLAGPVSASAMRATNCLATPSFDCIGQDSTPFAVIRCTALSSPPIAPPCTDTSFATIQSQPLRLNLALACSITFSVSAAKPITNCGRFVLSVDTV